MKNTKLEKKHYWLIGFNVIIFLIIIIYTSALHPALYIPERCNLGSQIACLDFEINIEENNMRILLRNDIDEINVERLEIYTDDNFNERICEIQDPINNWKSNSVETFIIDDCNFKDIIVLTRKGIRIFLKLSYYKTKSGSVFMHEIKGEIFTRQLMDPTDKFFMKIKELIITFFPLIILIVIFGTNYLSIKLLNNKLKFNEISIISLKVMGLGLIISILLTLLLILILKNYVT